MANLSFQVQPDDDPKRRAAIEAIHDCLLLCADQIGAGQTYADAWRTWIAENLFKVLNREVFTAEENSKFDIASQSPPGVRPHGKPARWATRNVGPLIGRSQKWHAELLKSSTPKGVRRRPRDVRSERARSHPGEFDRFTEPERRFYRLPPDVQFAIEREIEIAIHEEDVRQVPLEKSIRGYFAKNAKMRDTKSIPWSLREAIAKALKAGKYWGLVTRSYPVPDGLLADDGGDRRWRVDWPVPAWGSVRPPRAKR